MPGRVAPGVGAVGFLLRGQLVGGYVSAQPDHGIELLLLIETTSDLELIREQTPTLIVLQIFEPRHS